MTGVGGEITRALAHTITDPLFHLTRLYASAREATLRELAAHVSNPVKHLRGSIVIPSDPGASGVPNPPPTVLIVVDGSIESFFKRDGKTFIGETYGRGDVIGLMEEAETRPFYQAVDASETLKVSVHRFAFAMQEDGMFATCILKQFVRCHTVAIRRMADLALDDVAARVWAELQRSAVQRNPGTTERIVRLTQKELAERVGSCRETVSRAMNALKREGRIQQIKNRTYLIPASM
jgi:CRP-like cAMP-binding protein